MIKTNSRDLLFIPEVVGLDARSSIMRIPPELDVLRPEFGDSSTRRF